MEGREGAGAQQHGWATPWRQPCFQAPLFWPQASIFIILPWSLTFYMDWSWRILQFDQIKLRSQSLPSCEPRGGGTGEVSWPWLYQKPSLVSGPGFRATLEAEKNQTLNIVQKTMEQVWFLEPVCWIGRWCHGATLYHGWGLTCEVLVAFSGVFISCSCEFTKL